MPLLDVVGKEIRDRFSGAVEAFSRRQGSGSSPRYDHARQRSSEDVPSSKDVVKFYFVPTNFTFSYIALYLECCNGRLLLHLQHPDSERGRNSSRYGSTSRKAIISNKATSSGEQFESRLTRVSSSSGGRPSPVQRVQPAFEAKPAFARTSAARGTRDDHPLRGFELLSIRK